MPYAQAADHKVNATNRRVRKRSIMDEALGSECIFCGSTRTGTGGLTAHRKDGAFHRPFHYMGFPEFIKEMASNDYVRVCYRCHHGIHWAMEFLGYDWNTIEQTWKHGGGAGHD